MWCWELNLGVRIEQPVLLNAESSLQSLNLIFLRQDLSLRLELIPQQKQLARRLQGSSCLCLPRTEGMLLPYLPFYVGPGGSDTRACVVSTSSAEPSPRPSLLLYQASSLTLACAFSQLDFNAKGWQNITHASELTGLEII